MPVSKITRQEATERIAAVFRQHGYAGATLRLIADATGLGRASLYHHFPGGKDEMVESVFELVGGQVQRECLAPLQEAGTPRARLQKHARGVERLYDGGRCNCLLGAMLLGGGGDRFSRSVQTTMKNWIESVAAVLKEAGLPAAAARKRVEEALVRIQGALIVSRGLQTTSPFRTVVRELPDSLLAPA